MWHRLWCVPLNRNTIRETVDGVLGFRCGCGHFEPAVRRLIHEREDKHVAPAHERYHVRRLPKQKNIASLLKMR